jgi:hypothetical protein
MGSDRPGPSTRTKQADFDGEFRVVTRASNGLHTSTFSTPHGRILVHLPADLAAGDDFVGSMELSPVGAGRRRVRNLKALEALGLRFSENSPSIRAGYFRAQIPREIPGFVYLQLVDGKSDLAWAMVPCSRDPAPPADDSDTPSSGGLLIPWGAEAGQPIAIQGHFDLAPENWKVRLGGKSAPVLASSPRSLVVRSPKQIIGRCPIEINHGALTLASDIQNIAVSTKTPARARTGQRIAIRVTVKGLHDLPIDVSLSLAASGELYKVPGNLDQILAIRPERIKNGTYQTTLTLMPLRTAPVEVALAINAALFATLVYSNCWTCSGCSEECQGNDAKCTVGAQKSDPPVADYGPIQFGNTQWMRYRTKSYECVEVVCRNWIGQECCRYTKWKEMVGFMWKTSTSKDSAGQPIWVDDPPALPCRCGSLLEITLNLGFAGFDKYGAFKEAREKSGCPGLSWEAAADLAKNCGFGSFWDSASSLSGKDWFEVFQKALAVLGAAGGATPNPLTPSGPPVPMGK